MSLSVGRRAALVCALIAALLCALPALAENDDDRPTPAYWRDVEVMYGQVNIDMGVNLRVQPKEDAARITSIQPGEVFQVLSVYNDKWLEISFEGSVGYAVSQYITWWSVTDQIESADEPDITIVGADTDVPITCLKTGNMSIKGTVTTSQAVVEAEVSVYDVRQNRIVKSASSVFPHEDNVRTVDLSAFNGRLGIPSLAAGEKQLVITCKSVTGSSAEIRRNFYIVGEYGEVANITSQCDISVSRGEGGYMTDGSHRSAWQPHAGSTATILIPEDRDAGKLVVSWITQPASMTMTVKNAAGEVIQTLEETNPSNMLYFVYDLAEGARRVELSGFSGNENVAELIVIERGNVSPALMQWQPLPEKIDLLVVSTHQDDELLFIGGTVPYYVAQGKTVGIVYMATCNRRRVNEAMEGMWTCGMRYHPIFLGYADGHADSVAMARSTWTEKALADLVAVIRRYKPEVIVTQDVNGEYGHMQHQLTVELVREAVDVTNNAGQFPQSAEMYGTWDVKKTYLHLYGEQKRTMTCFTEPLDYFNTLSPRDVAHIAYQKHYTQLTDFTFDITGKRYDNTVFGLYRSTVGDDEAMDDFFEHIG